MKFSATKLASEFNPDMPNLVVDIGQMRINAEPGNILVAQSIGFGMAVAVFNQEAQIGGLIHFVLPHSSISPKEALRMPALFGDSGIRQLLGQMMDLGGDPQKLVVKAAGAGRCLTDGPLADIALQNIQVVKQCLNEAQITQATFDVGGYGSRTIEMHLASGRFIIRTMGTEKQL